MTKFDFITETNPITGYVRYWTEKDGIYVDHTISDQKEQAYQRLACYNELMSYLESIAKTSEIKSKAWKIF